MTLPELHQNQSLEPVGAQLPETIECRVSRWIEVAPQAGSTFFEKAILSEAHSRRLRTTPLDALNDSVEINALTKLITEVKLEMCPDCPQPVCPVEGIMHILQKAPLKSASQIVIDGFFKEG